MEKRIFAWSNEAMGKSYNELVYDGFNWSLSNEHGFGGFFDAKNGGRFRACETYACGIANPSFKFVGKTVDEVRAAIN